MHFDRDAGQIKFWQVLIAIAIVGLIAFDLLSPQLVKVQLKDKADSLALQESKYVVTAPSGSGDKYYVVCDRIQRDMTAYGARLLPAPDQIGAPPEEICPSIADDGRISFKVEKKAGCIALCRVGLENYYRVSVEVSEKFSN